MVNSILVTNLVTTSTLLSSFAEVSFYYSFFVLKEQVLRFGLSDKLIQDTILAGCAGMAGIVIEHIANISHFLAVYAFYSVGVTFMNSFSG